MKIRHNCLKRLLYIICFVLTLNYSCKSQSKLDTLSGETKIIGQPYKVKKVLEVWRNDSTGCYRGELFEFIENSIQLNELKEEELFSLLGKPNKYLVISEYGAKYFTYYLSRSCKSENVTKDDIWSEVKFYFSIEKGKVNDYSITTF